MTGAPTPPTPSALSALLARASGTGIASADRERAFAELVRLVMISVRAAMGRRLRDHRESADVCQSVARSFVDDFDQGRVEFRSEADLAAYLQRAVRSKLADLARHDTALKRGGQSTPAQLAPHHPTDSADHSHATNDPIAPTPTASMQAQGAELQRAITTNLTDEEQDFVRLRAQGLEWEAIAKLMNRDPAALRKQFSRAQERFRS